MNLSEKKLQELKNKKISIEELYDKYFHTQKDGVNVENILKLLTNDVCSFKDIVDKFKSMEDSDNAPYLYRVLKNKDLFEDLFENNKLNKEDLRYLLNKIDTWVKLDTLCENTSLFKEILKEFVLDKEDVDRFNTMIKNDCCKRTNVYNIFDMIECHNIKDREVMKLNELNRKIYLLNNFDLNDSQKLELSEILRDNEQAQSLLIQIVENHLEDQYDFETLKELLTKYSEKKKIKMNF